jgi:hypothetical protein
MDFGFVSEFQKGNRTFRYIDGHIDGIVRGGSSPLSESFCKFVVDGKCHP